MRRLVIDGVIFGLQKAGGISRMWAEILLGLDEHFASENHVYVLIPTNVNVEWERVAPLLRHIKVVKRRRFRWGKRTFWREKLYLSLVAFKLRPTLWHTSFFVGFPYWKGCRGFSFLYDMIPEKLAIASTYETDMKYRTLKSSKTIFSISSCSKKDLEEAWPEFKGKSIVSPICTAPMPAAEKPGSSYFVYLGTRKGYKNFLPAISEILKDPRFLSYEIQVIGGEKGWTCEEEDTFNALGAQKRVHLLGTLSLEGMQQVIVSSSAILFPSLYEGFGLPVLEAFLAGLPVLACRTSSIPEISGEEYPLVEKNTPGSYSDTLFCLLKEKEKWVNYGKKRAELFTRKKMMEMLLKEYHAL